MTALHRARIVTAAVVACLEDAGLLAGDGEKPVAGGWQGTPGQSTFTPYVAVYNLVGGYTDGSIVAPDEFSYPTYQLTSVGSTAAQCEWQADACREALLTGPVLVEGRAVNLVTVEMLGGAVRDDDAQPPVWFSPDRYRLSLVPSDVTYQS